MVDLGIAAGAANAGPVIGKPYSQAWGSTAKAASRNVADVDSAAAMIRNPHRYEDSHLRPGQFPHVQQRSSKVQARPESSTSSLTRIQEGVGEALALQANVEPDRALQLLKVAG